MTYQSTFEKETFQRIDNANVIDFLTSCAHALNESGDISIKDSNDLRVSLSEFQSKQNQTQEAVLPFLISRKSHFLMLLQLHFGAIALCQNLLRHSIRNFLNTSTLVFNRFGEMLLEKGKLHFNKSFYIFVGDECEKRTLFSSILVELSQVLNDASLTIQDTLKTLSTLVPGQTNKIKKELNEKITASLGFSGICLEVLPFKSEMLIKNKLICCFKTIITALEDINDQFIKQKQQCYTARLQLCLDSLKAELYHLEILKFPKILDLATLDMTRTAFLELLESINNGFHNISELFLALLNLEKQFLATPEHPIPHEMVRVISHDLLSSGAGPEKAYEASHALVQYCAQHNIKAHQLIEEELSKIHPNLSQSALKLFQQLEKDQALTHFNVDEKKRNYDLTAALLQNFQSCIQKLMAILILAIFPWLLTDCGLKLDPKSDIKDYRPEVPYKNEPASIEKDVLDPQNAAPLTPPTEKNSKPQSSDTTDQQNKGSSNGSKE